MTFIFSKILLTLAILAVVVASGLLVLKLRDHATEASKDLEAEVVPDTLFHNEELFADTEDELPPVVGTSTPTQHERLEEATEKKAMMGGGTAVADQPDALVAPGHAENNTVSATSNSEPSAVIWPEDAIMDQLLRTQPEPQPQPSYFAFDNVWREKVVNIFCLNNKGGGYTGSGVMIDPRGVILTNAHVAEPFLFLNYPTEGHYSCQIRIGSPAYPVYRAELLYIPEGFIESSLKQRYKPDDSGYVYGRKDYALLVITGRTDPTSVLPAAFPYMSVSSDSPATGAYVYVMGYPAASLGGSSILRDLYMLASPAIVEQEYTIEGGSIDVIAFAGTIAGQQGASGGAVVGKGGLLAGIPTFFSSKPGRTTADNILNAITTSYISRDIANDTGLTLDEFVGRDDLAALASQYMAETGIRYAEKFYRLFLEREG